MRQQTSGGKKRPPFRGPKDERSEAVKAAEKALRGKALQQMEAAVARIIT